MGVYLHNMEMPTSCYLCPFCDYVSARCDAVKGTPYTPTSRYEVRADWCPLVPTADVRPVKWIPVTERLPSYGDWVLGIGPKQGYYVCEYRGITHWPSGGDDPRFSAKGSAVTITHWMPLPEPPKEEG